ncbi:NAD(P)/FAD-dependent oxidoreductase [Paenibacillus glucanolyticus]|uniref:NAD(P)/FAD-dependent oxidoreductase n=1 Tax=Paenibacillus glucanolyticus TaxID=59843 RepID=UPI00096D464A|nr:FAD-binding oxidoreductase [Paenibacillus glucanolyticus]OMF78088.1 amino acid oxidase [Paenibacillus glucanolyticus]
MLLTGGTTPWKFLNTEPVKKYPPLTEQMKCEVLVIGGGISGALMAYVLNKQGVDTILLEKRRVCGGSTSANTGLLQFSNDCTLTDLIRQFDDHRGTSFYKMCSHAVRRLTDIANSLSRDSGLIPRSSLYYASTPQDVGMLRHEYDLLKRRGFDVEYWNRDDIKAHFPFSKEAAIYTHGDAEVDPYRLGHHLLQDASQDGLRIYENSEVTDTRYTDSDVTVITDQGSVLAQKVIWATGYTIQEWKPDHNAELLNTYAILTEPVADLSSWYERSFLWETNRPYLYFRTTPDQRIIAGGLDEALPPSGKPEEYAEVRGRRLLDEIQQLFPHLADLRIACSWAGVFASTKDGIPLIGKHPKYPHSYFIEVYGGNGTVYSMIAADLLAETIAGREPEELKWFSLTRPIDLKII